jgi:DNA replicative helicase MCM subunit Mcm2 (Cdc46/Mcm family)
LLFSPHSFYRPFYVNAGIDPPSLSRFDLTFKLVDGIDVTTDANVATFLLNWAIQGSGYGCDKPTNDFSKRSPWNIDKLRAYIATIKSCFHPTISPNASMLLGRHYS